ncbi:hypothetical protein Tco_1186591 [Tanacetum coccineum]
MSLANLKATIEYQEAIQATEDIESPAVSFEKISDYKGGLTNQVNVVIKQNNTLLYLASKQSQKLIELEEKFDKLKQKIHTIIENEIQPADLEDSISSLAKRLDNFSISGKLPLKRTDGKIHVFEDPNKIFKEQFEKNKEMSSAKLQSEWINLMHGDQSPKTLNFQQQRKQLKPCEVYKQSYNAKPKSTLECQKRQPLAKWHNQPFIESSWDEPLTQIVFFNGLNSRQHATHIIKQGSFLIEGNKFKISLIYAFDMNDSNGIEMLTGANLLRSMKGGIRIKGDEITIYKKITKIKTSNQTKVAEVAITELEVSEEEFMEINKSIYFNQEGSKAFLEQFKPVIESLKHQGYIGEEPLKHWKKNGELCKLDIPSLQSSPFFFQ